jgi:hypothetical protein
MLQTVLPYDCRSLRRSSNLPYSSVINKIKKRGYYKVKACIMINKYYYHKK